MDWWYMKAVPKPTRLIAHNIKLHHFLTFYGCEAVSCHYWQTLWDNMSYVCSLYTKPCLLLLFLDKMMLAYNNHSWSIGFLQQTYGHCVVQQIGHQYWYHQLTYWISLSGRQQGIEYVDSVLHGSACKISWNWQLLLPRQRIQPETNLFWERKDLSK